MDHKTLHSWTQFTEFGINFLTGEACARAQRLLCDLSQQGVEHITAFLGGNVNFAPASNWNSHMYHGEEVYDAVASVLLPRSIFKDLAAFLLLEQRWYAVLIYPHEVVGIDEDVFKRYAAGETWMGGKADRIILNPGFSRNQHQMSGRVE